MDDNTGFLTLLMNFVAPLALGLAILYLLLRTRRVDWRQRQHTEKAAEDLYDRVEDQRAEEEQRARKAQR